MMMLPGKHKRELETKLLLLFIPLLAIALWFLGIELPSGSTGGGGGYDLTLLYFAFFITGYGMLYEVVMFIWFLFLVLRHKEAAVHIKCMWYGALVTIAGFVYLLWILV